MRLRSVARPVLVKHCYDCHGDGANKGKVAFDGFKSDEELLATRDLWTNVLKNLRADLMPPASRPRPTVAEKRRLEAWIKRDALGIDPRNPDPGRVTIRRLNRVEYRNTIRDLMGFDFKVEEELPPDDTGYGFDNIGDVLTVSPMLLEKYMQAAEVIAAAAVPRVPRVVQEKTVAASADRHSFYEPAKLTEVFSADESGQYRVALELEVAGQFDFDPGRSRVVFTIDDRELLRQEFGWQDKKIFRFEYAERWQAGPRRLALELTPLMPPTAGDQRKNAPTLRVVGVTVRGPLEPAHWARPKNFERFFSRDPPEDATLRRGYALEVLSRMATRAYRRPVDRPTLDRLVAIAEGVYSQPDKRFEDGIAQAMVPVLASPRFLFRVEDTEPVAAPSLPGHPLIDEYALASRLSYFLWSTMPDDELFLLADQGKLRRSLSAQVKRMLADPRSAALIENFVGQWLQTRDVDGIDINAKAVLARDDGNEKEVERLRQQLREQQAKAVDPKLPLTPEQTAEREKQRERIRQLSRPRVELDKELRAAMREETLRSFAHVVRNNRSVLELVDSDYTFLNEKLARHYGISGVTGTAMRRVALPANHVRGGVLTQGSVLVVTSNPTRTSPVKRGLFVLENVLGIPPPPPPADVPALEESERASADREPTLREILAIHRGKPLCNSCHNRMDPLGLALENFNALGMWRQKERGQPVDATGKLITGEPFTDIRQVKRVIATTRRSDFYRCLTEKLLTYALGRGLEYYDIEAVDQIVGRLDRDQGRFSTLLMAVIESTPFQKRRNASAQP